MRIIDDFDLDIQKVSASAALAVIATDDAGSCHCTVTCNFTCTPSGTILKGSCC